MDRKHISFYKYQGTGNDFILVDNRLLGWKPSQQQVEFLCDRHFGIGADGLMLLNMAGGFDFGMTYFNSDGKESTMCGNGGRCITAFAESVGLIESKAYFLAADGEHEALILAKNGRDCQIRLKMKDTAIGKEYQDGIFIDTGSPHFVIQVDTVMDLDVFNAGRDLRLDGRFSCEGTNVDFVEKTSTGLFVRTYERGVENETLSCGTGVTAAALAMSWVAQSNTGKTEISTPGGNLTVFFRRDASAFTEVWLEGPAKFVFTGGIIFDERKNGPMIFDI
jgi:diaminopimelate epimerase